METKLESSSFYSTADIQKLYGIARSEIGALCQAGVIPKPFKHTRNKTRRWRRIDIDRHLGLCSTDDDLRNTLQKVLDECLPDLADAIATRLKGADNA